MLIQIKKRLIVDYTRKIQNSYDERVCLNAYSRGSAKNFFDPEIRQSR